MRGLVTTASVSELAALIGRQTSNGVRLALRPKFLIVAPEYEGTARVIVDAQYGLSADGFQMESPNTMRGRLEVISDVHLTGTAFYLAADPLTTDTLEVSYLDGRAEVRVEAQKRFDNDGGMVKAALEIACTPLDYRGLAMNVGTAS